MRKNGIISGLSVRLDVATKCRIVYAIFSKKFKNKKELNTYINNLAKENNVNPLTVKIWCGKYQNTYKQGMHLPTGVMSFSFATIGNENLNKTRQELSSIKLKIEKIKKNQQTQTYLSLSMSSIENSKTPNEVLDTLITNKVAK